MHAIIDGARVLYMYMMREERDDKNNNMQAV